MNKPFKLEVFTSEYDVEYFDTLEDAVKRIKEIREEVYEISYELASGLRYRLTEEVVISEQILFE